MKINVLQRRSVGVCCAAFAQWNEDGIKILPDPLSKHYTNKFFKDKIICRKTEFFFTFIFLCAKTRDMSLSIFHF